MKILIVGASGTIGSAVADRLKHSHTLITAGFSHGDLQCDLSDLDSLHSLFEHTGDLDAIICAAGLSSFGPFEHLTQADYQQTLDNKLMGQVNLVRLGRRYLRPGGSITLTSGFVSQNPVPGSACVAMANGALESFARAVALELPQLRVNVVCPSFVEETLAMMGMSNEDAFSADQTAEVYLAALNGTMTGQTLRVAELIAA
ncbi:short chain dehydrogenase [Ferrimonas sp.]|uniref:short chain dehydrogenase n=1 Tax=Ferrimonas sp. TaxID=2080861 RepID=UPI003A9496A7